MKKIGIVGGVGWRSTVDYYSEICRRSEQSGAIQEISIESLDLHQAVAYLGTDGDEDSWKKFDDYHRAALQRLERSGAAFALMASNTPHHRFAAIVRGTGIPVINLFEVTAKECARIGAKEVLILGTRLTMGSTTFCDAFAGCGVEACGPGSAPARDVTIELISELQRGKVEGAAERIGKIAGIEFERQFKTQPVVCLACTELPLAFPEQKTFKSFEYGGVVYVNTTAAHIDAALEWAVD